MGIVRGSIGILVALVALEPDFRGFQVTFKFWPVDHGRNYKRVHNLSSCRVCGCLMIQETYQKKFAIGMIFLLY